MMVFDYDTKFEKVVLKQDGNQIEILKLCNNTLLTLTCKSFTTSVAVTEEEFEKIKANLVTIKEKMIPKQHNKPECIRKRSKSENDKKRKTTESIIEIPSPDLYFMEHIPQYSDSQGELLSDHCNVFTAFLKSRNMGI